LTSIKHKKIILLIVIPLILLNNISYAKSTELITNFEWEKSIVIQDLEIPMKIAMPIRCTIEGLPDKAKPNEEFQVTIELQPVEGANIAIFEKTLNIDTAVSGLLSKPYEIDLSSFNAITTPFLTTLLETQLNLPHDAAESLALVAESHTQLILKNDITIETIVKGPAVAQPASISTWFNTENHQSLRILPDSYDTDQVEVQYIITWKLLLMMDLAEEVYNDTAAGPILKKLTQLIGLPLSKELGSVEGKEKIIHIIHISTPVKLTSRTILLVIGIVVVLIVGSIVFLLKYPRKGQWK
jgi:hypothetical protein